MFLLYCYDDDDDYDNDDDDNNDIGVSHRSVI